MKITRCTVLNCNYATILSFLVINSRPELKDLCNLVTPKYSAYWKVIGTLLGIENGTLDAIELDFPTNNPFCCNKFLVTWLDKDTAASWKKIIEVINSPAVAALRNGGTPSTIAGFLQVISGNYLAT